MKKFVLFFFVLNFSFLFAQHPEVKRATHWYFGWNAGLDFSNDTVIADVNGAYDNYEATATISDTAGNLLFYTDAETVWNRNHQVMQNGTNIGGCWSSTQGALIVPQPGNDSIYYIFTTDCAENNLAGGLRYSIVNINLDNGLGALTQKGILLHTPVAEKLAGIYHSNKTDVWVVTHEWNSSNFLAYLIAEQGIDTIPIVSNIGTIHSGGTYGYDNAIGYMKISPDGKKLISLKIEAGNIELLNFNNTTGSLSNLITLPQNPSDYICSGPCSYWYYGASFSSDNSKLYISRTGLPGETPSKIYQYDLTTNNIASSRVTIINSSNQIYALQIGKDNKIYVAMGNPAAGIDYLGIINNPNQLGMNCNYIQAGIYLSGRNSRDGLPNFIESYFNCDTCAVDSSNVGIFEPIYISNNISIFPNPFNDNLFINSSHEITSWNIKDVWGEVLRNDVYQVPRYSIEISNLNLPKGIYTIYVTTMSFNHIQKLIKYTDS